MSCCIRFVFMLFDKVIWLHISSYCVVYPQSALRTGLCHISIGMLGYSPIEGAANQLVFQYAAAMTVSGLSANFPIIPIEILHSQFGELTSWDTTLVIVVVHLHKEAKREREREIIQMFSMWLCIFSKVKRFLFKIFCVMCTTTHINDQFYKKNKTTTLNSYNNLQQFEVEKVCDVKFGHWYAHLLMDQGTKIIEPHLYLFLFIVIQLTSMWHIAN